MSRSRVFVVLLGFVLAAAMVTMSISAAGANAAGKGPKAPKATGKASFTAKGSIGQVYVKDANAEQTSCWSTLTAASPTRLRLTPSEARSSAS